MTDSQRPLVPRFDGPVNVLLVDDQQAGLFAAHAALEGLGLNLVSARSGEEALARTADADFAAILLDVQMTGIDGLQTARRIRATERGRYTPILFSSAHDDKRLEIEAYALGAVDYLVKPVQREVLRAKVTGWASLFAAKEQARRQADQLRLLVEGVKEYAVFMLDADGRVVTWNEGARRLKGYEAHEIIGQHFSRFYPPDVVARGWPRYELEVAAREGRFEDEGWRVRKDGSTFWANVVITALRDPSSGHLRGFAKVTRDLTDRRRAEADARRLFEEQATRRALEAGAETLRRAHEETRRQREQLRVTLSSIGDAVIVTDTKGAVSFLNPVAEALTDWSAGDAAGKPLDEVFRIVNQDTRLPAVNPVTKALRDGVIVGLANHTLLISRDGTERPIDDSAAPIRAEDGSVAGVVLVFRDVSEARQALMARLRLAAIVESSEDAIIGKTLDGVITSWNRGAERLYGYTAAEIVGKPLSVLMPPDQPDELPALLARVKRGDRIAYFETVRLRKDGRLLNVWVTISPVTDAEGRIVGASTIARDITAQKRRALADRFLADAGSLLAQVQDVSSTLQKVAALAVPRFADWCVVDMLQPDGSLKLIAAAHADPAKVRLAEEFRRRFPPDPASDRGNWGVIRSGRPEFVPQITEQELAQAVTDPEKLRALRQLGLSSYMAVPLRVRGTVRGVIGFVSAESGRCYDEADLATAEELVRRAGVAIENALLYSELREADRHKDEFLAMLAHELRNPLAPIRNSLQIMKLPAAAPADVARMRDVADRQVSHMARLLDDLLDVARISRGRIELREEVVDMATVVNRAVEAGRPYVEGRGHRLTVSLPPDPLPVRGDPARLEQILTNLVNNAAKYTEPGGQVSVTLEREPGRAVLRVRDTGIGIERHMLTRVFDVFVQAERRLDRAQGGVGIGLSLVKRLVELHGGTVEACSAGRGQGSEFVVRLPVYAGEPGGGDDAAGDATADAPRRRVLVVDDNVDAAQSLETLLRLEGQDVRVAHDGVAALRTAGEFKPDLVLLDIGMPGLNGYEVCQRLRQDPSIADARVVALTGWGQEEDRRRSREAGFDDHLVKPVEAWQLRNALLRR